MNTLQFTLGNTEFTFFETKEAYDIANTPITPPHLHALPELFVVLEGEAVISDGMERQRITKRNICLIPPRVYHSILNDASYRRIAIFFIIRKLSNRSLPDTYCAFSSLLEGQKILLSGFSADFSEMLFSCLENRELLRSEKIKNIISLILIEFLQLLPAKSREEEHVLFPKKDEYYETLVKIDSLIDPYITSELSYEELCRVLYLSSRQCSRMIAAEYRENLVKLRSEGRMKRAEFYLQNTSLSSAQIAELLGYASQEAFSILFKKHYKKTPASVRKNYI